MTKMNGRIIFYGILLAMLLIVNGISNLLLNTVAVTSSENVKLKQVPAEKKSPTASMIHEEIDKAQFIEKATAELEKNGYQVGFILSIHSETQKKLEAVVRSETTDKKKAMQEIIQIIDKLSSENQLGMFYTTVNFSDE